MRTLTVTGEGTLKLRPDTMRLMMTVNGQGKAYGACLKKAEKAMQELLSLLESIGFARTDLKTLDFWVRPEYKSCKKGDSAETSRTVLVGYRSVQEAKLEFPMDNARLGRILTGIAEQNLPVEVEIDFILADEGAARNRVLAKAVEDARTKAQVLATSAGTSLGKILSITYAWGRVDLEIKSWQDEELFACCTGKKMDFAFEPDDITASDHVTLVWAIGEEPQR